MKHIKKIVLVLLLCIPFITVKANTISDIKMDIYVDQDGNATITETWDAYVNQGTEGYHPYFNIGNSSIEVISASMDGEPYTIDYYWNIDKSLSEKAYKAGLYKTGNEVDICYGITTYGSHKYEIKYRINKFVSNLEDADMILVFDGGKIVEKGTSEELLSINGIYKEVYDSQTKGKEVE